MQRRARARHSVVAGPRRARACSRTAPMPPRSTLRAAEWRRSTRF